MKSRFKLIAMVLGGLVCLQSTGAAETQPAGVDYLKLTRGNVPNARTLVDETLKNLDFNLATFKERVRKIRMSSFLPESVNLGYDHYDSALREFGFSGKRSYETNYENDGSGDIRDEKTSTNRLYGNTGQYSDGERFSLSMRWDLADLFGVNSETLYTLGNVMNQIDQEGFAIGQIAKSYGKLMAALPAEADQEISESQVYVIFENAGILDTLSGGALTAALTDAEKFSHVVVTPNGNALEKEMQKTEKALQPESGNVIEIRDGQDDGIEVIGGGVAN